MRKKQQRNRSIRWSLHYQNHNLFQNNKHGMNLVSHLNQNMIFTTWGENF